MVSHALQRISSKVKSGERLSFADGLRLFESPDLLAVGEMAQQVRLRRHGYRTFYAVNLHLNPTNICTTRCKFCSFSRDAGASDAYALTLDAIEEKVRGALEQWKINEVHIVGGHNPTLDLNYYLEMIRRIRALGARETFFIKAFSAPEIDAMAKNAGLSWVEVLRRLKGSGLEGMPGGGAEIFASEVRAEICPQKIPAQAWLAIHRIAHGFGLKTNATLLYGHIETAEHCVAHLLKLRELQDETKGFSAFVPLAYNPHHNALSGMKETSGFLDLKMLSISRLLLDNISHIKAHGSATDLKFIQAAISFGADDVGGTNLHERVLHEAGSRSPEGLSSEDLVRCIKAAGFEPCLTNSSYSIKTPSGDRSIEADLPSEDNAVTE